MPFISRPSTDAARLLALAGAAAKAAATAPTEMLLTPEQLDQLNLAKPASLHTIFKRDCEERGTALSQQGVLTEQHAAAAATLSTFLSHFIQVFNFGVTRGRYDRADRAYYQLAIDRSDVPIMSTYAELDLWAGRIIDGEAQRVADRHGPAMENPSAAEVATARAALSALQATHTAAKDAYDKEQQDVEIARPAVNAFLADVWDTIEFKLRTLSGPSRRRRAREWGVVYVTRPGETPDPEPGSSEGGTNGAGGGGTPA